jgi:hypothetical protein
MQIRTKKHEQRIKEEHPGYSSTRSNDLDRLKDPMDNLEYLPVWKASFDVAG